MARTLTFDRHTHSVPDVLYSLCLSRVSDTNVFYFRWKCGANLIWILLFCCHFYHHHLLFLFSFPSASFCFQHHLLFCHTFSHAHTTVWYSELFCKAVAIGHKDLNTHTHIQASTFNIRRQRAGCFCCLVLHGNDIRRLYSTYQFKPTRIRSVLLFRQNIQTEPNRPNSIRYCYSYCDA